MIEQLDPKPSRADTTYLGPGWILATEDDALLLDTPQGVVRALPALSASYLPAPGDEVLAVGDERGWFAVGLLKGSGTTRFESGANLEIASRKLSLHARDGVSICANRITFISRKLRLRALTLLQRFHELTTRIQGRFRARSRDMLVEIETEIDLEARNITLVASKDVEIEGRLVHLS